MRVRPSRDAASALRKRCLGYRVQGRGCFIQDQQAGTPKQRPSNGDPLPLPGRYLVALLANFGFKTLWKPVDEVVQLCLPQRVS